MRPAIDSPAVNDLGEPDAVNPPVRFDEGRGVVRHVSDRQLSAYSTKAPGDGVMGRMARPWRIEYEGACYHVINRGNYRRSLFAEGGAGPAFERTLGEAAEQYGWQVHAYVVMRNHLFRSLRAGLVGVPPRNIWRWS